MGVEGDAVGLGGVACGGGGGKMGGERSGRGGENITESFRCEESEPDVPKARV